MRRVGPGLASACLVCAFAAIVALAVLHGARPAPDGLAPGQEVPIAGSGIRWAIAASPEAMEAWRSRPDDEGRLQALDALAGVESGRRVRLLSREGDLWRVQVLEGPRVGAIGWMARAALGR